MIEYKEVDYKNYGKCLEISNGKIDLLVTLDIGPRIIRYGFCGKENMFFEDINREQYYDKEDMRELYGDDKTWYLYGGHRLWISPEYADTYYPDNTPVAFEKIKNGAVFVSEAQAITGLQFTITVEIVGDTEVKVSHYVSNNSGESQDYALWALTVLSSGGTEIIKMNDNDTELLPNRMITAWPYTNLADERLYLGKKFVTLKQIPGSAENLKLGFDLNYGTAAYLNHGSMFVKKYTHYDGSEYPDGGCSFETFTNKNFLECETLGELGAKPDGSVTCHVENWKLYDGVAVSDPKNEEELAAIWAKIDL